MRKSGFCASLFLLILVSLSATFFCASFVSCKQKQDSIAQKTSYKGKTSSATDFSDFEDDGEEGDPEFFVSFVNPQDELPSSVKYPSIQVQFSKPVVALKELGEPSATSNVLMIEPPLEGTFRWYGTSLLAFDSSESSAPQREYKIKINPNLRSAKGQKISGQTEFSFRSEYLRMTQIVPGYTDVKNGNYVNESSVPIEQAKDIAVYFNAPVNSAFVKNELKVFFGEKEVKSFDAESEKNNSIVLLKLKETPPEDTDVFVQFPSGSSADSGLLATIYDSEEQFHTIVPFEIEQFDDEPTWFTAYSNPVAVRFSSVLKQGSESELAQFVATDLNTKITAENLVIDGRLLIVHNLPVTFGSKYKIQFKEGLKDIYGRKLPETSTYEVTVPQALSYSYYKDYGLKMLESQFEPKIVFAHQNIKDGSKYSITGLTNATGNAINPDPTEFVMNPKQIPQNTKVIEPVTLTPQLQKVGDEWRGAVHFSADLISEYRYTDWSSGQKKTRQYHGQNDLAVQVTDLGVTVRYAYNKAVVLVTSLKTGKPIENANVSAVSISRDYREPFFNVLTNEQKVLSSSRTNAEGVAILPFDNDVAYEGMYIDVKTSNDRALFVPDSTDMYRTGIKTGNFRDATKKDDMAFLFTDRGLYKPGETVTCKIIDRTLQNGKYSTPSKANFVLSFSDGGWNSDDIFSTEDFLDENGTAFVRFAIPQDVKPGAYYVQFRRPGYYKTSCLVQVQFFERLRFEVSSSVPDVTFYRGDDISAQVSASYLGGGGMGDTSYYSYWTREPVGFTSSDSRFSEFRFGPQQGYDGRTTLDSNSGLLNEDGKITITQKSGDEKLNGLPYRYRMEAQVTDVGGQVISSVASAIVHPARFYIGVSGVKNGTGFAKKGDTVQFEYICLTPSSEIPLPSDLPKNKKMHVELLRENWKEIQQLAWNGQITTRYEREMITEFEEDVAISASNAPAKLSVVPPKGGAYLLRVSTTDSRGNDVITERHFYVTGSDWYWNNRNNSEELTLTADKDLYSVGETAQVMLQSPLPSGKYLMTIEREGILSEKIFDISEPVSVLPVPIAEDYVPVIYVALSSYSVRSGKPQNDFDTPDLDKPKGYFGVTALNVDISANRFDIAISADKPSYRPGQEAKITLKATKKGKPVANANITLMAVDRGVVDLIDYHVNDPVEFFYNANRFPNCVKGGDSRSLLLDPVTYEIRNLVGGDDGDDSKLQDRKNFDPTALFVNLKTDQNGNAECSFKLPDSLTAYRVTAVGVIENQFGKSESQIDVANPISVRTVLPRLLRINDKGELGVTISNIDSSAKNVSVSLAIYEGVEKAGVVQSEDEIQKVDGKAKIIGNASKSISVQAQKTQSLMFTVQGQKQGWITLEFTVRSDVVNERIVLPLQIEKPYIFETVATTGSVRSDSQTQKESASEEEKIVFPSGAEDGIGSLYIQLDPTRLGVLREAVGYVFHYPYGCLEQRSSAVMPLVAFGDYIKIFGLDSEVKKPKSVARSEIKSWASYQLPSGAFPYWPNQKIASPYVSMRLAEIFAIALNNDVGGTNGINLKALMNYLMRVANGMEEKYYYSDYSAAYSYFVVSELALASKTPFSTVSLGVTYVDKIADSSSDVKVLALCALTYLNLGQKQKAENLATKIRSYTKLTTRGIDISNGDSSWCFLNSDSEKFALLLQLFSRLSPRDDVNQHLVYELLKLQRVSKGYWRSTAGTTRVLISLNDYIKANHLEDLNYTADVLLNGKSVLGGRFKGVSAEPLERTIDFSENEISSLKKDTEYSLEFKKEGKGDLFYTTTLTYALPVQKQEAREQGICIYTQIEDVKTGQIVQPNKLEAGKVYRETVYISSTLSLEYVAVRAPVPAGCEIMNAAFVTTGSIPPRDSDSSESEEDDYERESSYRYNAGLSYQGIYDAEVQYFWNYFPSGWQKVDFLFRAVRNGEWTIPCATAECMYEEEIFGRTGGVLCKIE